MGPRTEEKKVQNQTETKISLFFVILMFRLHFFGPIHSILQNSGLLQILDDFSCIIETLISLLLIQWVLALGAQYWEMCELVLWGEKYKYGNKKIILNKKIMLDVH